MQHFDKEMCAMLVSATIGLSNLFLYCYFGKVATDSFSSMADCLYEANWHELPIELRKDIGLMLAHSQIPIHYHGNFISWLILPSFLF